MAENEEVHSDENRRCQKVDMARHSSAHRWEARDGLPVDRLG